MEGYVPYIVFGVAVALIGLALLLRFHIQKKTSVVIVKAALIKTIKQQEAFQDPEGNQHVRTIGMTLVFQTIQNELLTFQVNERYHGKAKEKQWGDLKYRGNHLIKFTCERGTIQKRIFV
ncbi:MAG: hypothetical protein HFJ84_03010 [Clostridiales bacterium]|jgi:hypothetical protein|nr:hypothetical protein [Clostridiales bacterium]